MHKIMMVLVVIVIPQVKKTIGIKKNINGTEVGLDHRFVK